MAQLALGAVGAVVGSAVGLPGVGFALGSALGGVLFPGDGPPDQVREGPRIHDSKVQNSAHGVMKSVVYGTVRIAGNVVWASEIEEVVNESTQSVGGKGGGDAKVTTRNYIYYRSFAVAICEGEIIKVSRVWANGKIVYDEDETNTLATDEGITFKQAFDQVVQSGGATSVSFYTGTESQSADSVMESVEGAGQVPAYRGMAYAVFERLELTEYGNTLPAIMFEVQV